MTGLYEHERPIPPAESLITIGEARGIVGGVIYWGEGVSTQAYRDASGKLHSVRVHRGCAYPPWPGLGRVDRMVSRDAVMALVRYRRKRRKRRLAALCVILACALAAADEWMMR